MIDEGTARVIRTLVSTTETEGHKTKGEGVMNSSDAKSVGAAWSGMQRCTSMSSPKTLRAGFM